MARPTSLGIIGWLLIILGMVGLLTALWSYRTVASPQVMALMARSPVPPAVEEAIGLLGSVVQLAAGVLMLRRVPAGRLLYAIWGGLGLLFGLWAAPVTVILVPGILIYAVIVFFLYRRPVGVWLNGGAHE